MLFLSQGIRLDAKSANLPHLETDVRTCSTVIRINIYRQAKHAIHQLTTWYNLSFNVLIDITCDIEIRKQFPKQMIKSMCNQSCHVCIKQKRKN